MTIKLAICFCLCGSPFFTRSQIKLENLQVDTTITGFHMAMIANGQKMFTQNGRSDLDKENPSAFVLMAMPSFGYYNDVRVLTKMLEIGRQPGYEVSDMVKIDSVVNGNKTFIISYNEIKIGAADRNQFFSAFFLKGNTAVVFISSDTDNGKYIEQFKKTFYGMP
ncbi:MAG: hypothetical protein JST75_14315 [Bacteroidetes bacterium]|nr:hypothetical protein [Bacteroidota bacterium]